MQQSIPGQSEIFQNIAQSSVSTLLIFLTEKKKKQTKKQNFRFVQLCFAHHLSCVSESTDSSLCFHSILSPVPHSNSCFYSSQLCQSNCLLLVSTINTNITGIPYLISMKPPMQYILNVKKSTDMIAKEWDPPKKTKTVIWCSVAKFYLFTVIWTEHRFYWVI